MGLRGRKRKRSGFVEDPRLGKRMKRGGRSDWVGQSSKLSGLRGRGFSSKNKPYVREAMDEDYMKLFQSACVKPAEEIDADFEYFMKYLGSLKARLPHSSRRGKVVGEGIEAGEFADNGEASKNKEKKYWHGSHKWKKTTPTGLSGDGHGNGVEESLAENILGGSSYGDWGMFLGHVKEEGGSYVVRIPMGNGKWSSFSYEAVDFGTGKGYAKRKEGRKGNGEVNCLKSRRFGVSTRSQFLLNRKRSPVVGRKTMNKTTDGLSCGRTFRNNQGFRLKTSVANSSLGNDNVFGDSLGDDTPCVNKFTIPGNNNVTVNETLDGEYEAFLAHLTVHETSYMLNVTTGDGKSISFLYGAEDCSTREDFAKGEGNDDLRTKKRGLGEDCMSSKFKVNQLKSDVVGRETINKAKDGSSSGMGLKNCQSNLLTSDANLSSGFRASDAYNATRDESLDGEYEMFLEHLTVHENSYMLNVTTWNGKNISFLYGAADEDFPCEKRRNEGICIGSKFIVNRGSPMVEWEETINHAKDGLSGGIDNSVKILDSTRRPTTESEMAVSTVNKVRLMELPNTDDALRTDKVRSMEAFRDLSQQGMETQNLEIAVSTVNKVWLMELPKSDDSSRTEKERGMVAYRDLSQQGMETHNPEIAVSTVNKARLMELPKTDDTLRTEKERGMEACRDLSRQGMGTLNAWNDTERSEGMNRPISREQSAYIGHEIEALYSNKQRCEEEVGGCDEQVDECLNLQMENLNADKEAIKEEEEEEEVDPTSSSDSDDIVIEIDPATFSHDNNTPFLPTDDPQLYVVQYDDEEDDPAVTNDHSEFRWKLMEILRQPYSNEEYDELWAEVSRPRQKQFDEDTPRSSQDKHSVGMSYLDQHKDFAKKIAEVQTSPDLKHQRPRMMNLLRGFVYLMQNLPAVGAFKPWADKLCLEVLPSLRRDGEGN